MQERFSGTTKRKVSHFILGEEGRVGSRSAFTAAAVVSVASLATMLLGTVQKAYAGQWCAPANNYCGPGNEYCCLPDPGPPPLPGRCQPNWQPGCWWAG